GTLMGGQKLRPVLASGRVRYVRARYGSLPALLAGALRPDVVITSGRSTSRGIVLGTEVSWLEVALRYCRHALVELNAALPDGTRAAPLPPERTTILAEVEQPPLALPSPVPSAVHETIGRVVADLLPPGCTLQCAPAAGGVG